MKKTARKMTLNRETLRHLNPENLADAAGGDLSRSAEPCLLCENDLP